MSAEKNEFDGRELTMTELEADFANLEDMRSDMENFAIFVDMIQRGDEA